MAGKFMGVADSGEAASDGRNLRPTISLGGQEGCHSVSRSG